MKIGIYTITNLINNKKYVGSSISIFKRKTAHFSNLRLNRHPNIHLQNAYNKYGKENFVFSIIDFVENKEVLLEKEQYYIDTLKPEYNKRLIAESNLGIVFSKEHREKNSNSRKGCKNHFFNQKHTDESKEKMRLAKIGKSLSLEHKNKIIAKTCQKVQQYDLNGVFVKEYLSLKETSLLNNFNYKHFIDIRKRKKGFFKNFYWFTEKDSFKEEILEIVTKSTH